MHDDGTITVYGVPAYKNSIKNPYGEAEITAALRSGDPKIRELWKTSLEHVGYFAKFEHMRPTLQKNTAEAIQIIMKSHGLSYDKANEIVQQTIDKLKLDKGTWSLTGEELAKKVNAIIPPPASSPAPTPPSKPKFTDVPNANDAYQALVKMGIGGVTPKQLAAKMQAIVDVEGTGLSVEEYTAKVTSKPTPPPTPTPDPVAPAEAEPTPTPEPPAEDYGKVRINMDNGSVSWTKPGTDIVRHFSANQLKNTASRKLWAALKKKGYPFDKFGVKTDVKEDVINPFQLSNFL